MAPAWLGPCRPATITAATAICSNRFMPFPQRSRALRQIEVARRRKRLIWIKGAVSALTLANGSGATVIEEGSAMPEKIDELLPTAREIQKQAALQEADKAEEYARRTAAADSEKRQLIEKL